jgi:hypothetical protein
VLSRTKIRPHPLGSWARQCGLLTDQNTHMHHPPPNANSRIHEHTHAHTHTYARTYTRARTHTNNIPVSPEGETGKEGGRVTFSPTPFLPERARLREESRERRYETRILVHTHSHTYISARTHTLTHPHTSTHTHTHTHIRTHANSYTLGAKQRSDRQTWMGLKPLPKPSELSPSKRGEISSPNVSFLATSPVYDSGVRRDGGGRGLVCGSFPFCVLLLEPLQARRYAHSRRRPHAHAHADTSAHAHAHKHTQATGEKHLGHGSIGKSLTLSKKTVFCPYQDIKG